MLKYISQNTLFLLLIIYRQEAGFLFTTSIHLEPPCVNWHSSAQYDNIKCRMPVITPTETRSVGKKSKQQQAPYWKNTVNRTTGWFVTTYLFSKPTHEVLVSTPGGGFPFLDSAACTLDLYTVAEIKGEISAKSVSCNALRSSGTNTVVLL